MKAKSARRLATLCSPIPDCGIGLFLCLRLVFCFGATNRDRLRLFRRLVFCFGATDCDRLRLFRRLVFCFGATNRDRLRPIATDCDFFRRLVFCFSTTDCDRIATFSAPCLLFRRDRDAETRLFSAPCLLFQHDRLRPIATDCDRIGRPPSTLFRPAAGIRSSFSQFFCHPLRIFTKILFFFHPLRFFTKILFFCHPLRFFTKMWGGVGRKS